MRPAIALLICGVAATALGATAVRAAPQTTSSAAVGQASGPVLDGDLGASVWREFDPYGVVRYDDGPGASTHVGSDVTT
jgi:hypothetical protein